MRASTLSLIAILTLSAAVTATTLPGCIGLASNTQCALCYKRKVKLTGIGCGPLLPAGDNCEVYTYNNYFKTQQCAICARGYSQRIREVNSKLTIDCVPGIIQDCLNESQSNGKHYCSSCANNKYIVESKSQTCRDISTPVPHCLWGSTYRVTVYGVKEITCSRCTPGYAVQTGDGACIPSPQPGCLRVRNGSCVECDPYSGYSITTEGRCVKTG